jgi:hypothetical protein
MKSKAFWMPTIGLTLVLSLFFIGCPMEVQEEAKGSLPSTKGAFTLTGADKAEGKYVFVNHPAEGNLLLGLSDLSMGNKFKGVQIKKGTAKIPLYLWITENSSIEAYNGNHNFSKIAIYISSQEELVQTDVVQQSQVPLSNVTFNNGSADKDISAYLEGLSL